MPPEKIRNIEKYCAMIEAVLFASSKPMTLGEIIRMTKINPEYIKEALRLLEIRYQKEDHGIILSKLGDSYKLSVKHEYSRRVAGITKSELSRGLLRVLSLIAYNQPANQSDIVKIIGNRTYEYVKDLEKMGFVKGEKKGKTKILTTTQAFESYFATSPEIMKKEMEKIKAAKDANRASEGRSSTSEQAKVAEQAKTSDQSKPEQKEPAPEQKKDQLDEK